MAQAQLTVNNDQAPAVRAALNEALLALASQNSGIAQPPTTYANMIWFNEASGELNMRTAADDGWILLGLLDQNTQQFKLNLAAIAGLIATTAQAGARASNSVIMTPLQVEHLLNVRNSVFAAAGGNTGDLAVNAAQIRLSLPFVATGPRVFATAQVAISHGGPSNDIVGVLNCFDLTTGQLVGTYLSGATASAAFGFAARLSLSYVLNLIVGRTYRYDLLLYKTQQSGPTFPRDMRIDVVNL